MVNGDSIANQCLTKDNLVKVVEKNKSEFDENSPNFKVYKKRWLMLALFVMSCGTNNLQFVQYSIISNIISRYYGVSIVAVDWTAMSFMFFYIPLIIPATIIFERIGLRWTVISSICITCLGAWIKVLSASPDRFYITLIGQSLVATMQTSVLSSPNRLAAQWFNSDQVSTATSLGVFGILAGLAIGFLIPPMIVKNHNDLGDIGKDLKHMYILYAVIITFVALLVIFFFQDEPKLPPSETRAILKVNRINNKDGFIQPMKRLFRNKCFLLLCNSYGMNIGVLNAISTLLNQIFLMHFPGCEEDAGRIGLIIILTGMIGSVTFGVIIDKTHKFKETTVTVYFLTICGQVSFAFAVSFEVKWMVYATATFLGFFMSGYFALGYEMCAEYTYPEPEFITSGILNVANNVYGIAFILVFGKLIEIYGDLYAHIGLCSALMGGFIITIWTKDEQRRENARKAFQCRSCPTAEVDDSVIL